ncbi:metallophosphoesterase family protein [Agrobacterium vitis]|uniref:Serine/threonine protein phosphatase n=1 Tax=Agrobacterium vitis TaxID=373 RepID=A0A1S2DPH9_AGRVI|nr:metallophosphoesterase family protein [Agrobacterium vitis]MCE6074187.1 serine/threonine protein phosphatase [Agrobacterium vitis]MCM2450701.1 serine/threonine protein phosphatase [Agrobacterium vitis]MCM2469018.1 serine/threonine protein phosphatase [Agrobacterium vitis]MUO71390.1 serine/threonine protein phosphatase [Agrobacterium vitis]MUO85147.1 serine/threonine protein phosphatase [Agrobacterium vitis]
MIKLLRKFLDVGSETGVAGMRSRVDIDPKAFSAIYAVGDVHGCYAELLEAECRILNDASAIDGPKLIVMLGDYVDRGPSSRRVIDHLMAPLAPGFERVSLCGNHDDVFCHFLDDPSAGRRWLDFGAAATLYSYGIDIEHALHQAGSFKGLSTELARAIPESHYAWLKSLPVMLKVGQFLFVHAGLKPGIALESQADEDLMWIREPFLGRGPELPYTVVHGHTPTDTVTFGKNRIGIDTGAYASGRLAVLRIAEGHTSLI